MRAPYVGPGRVALTAAVVTTFPEKHAVLIGARRVLLGFGSVCPEPDQAGEAFNDRRDDPVVGERVFDVLARGMVPSFGPRVQSA